ncbi:VOC family protein [Bacillus sp. FJAT-49732]|uniref:VOC family protein n=1 Tax=Lederbergia citrisecunda TaxID=2833583 RepID=A0A942TP56_9BACI|nr:VOC family protein [Lederbergia citrisecunda]MBS4199409.1 VOC family protein [Lederbergia citrisecunda]
MAVNVYMNFNGNCREAVEYYAQIFNLGTPEIMTFGDQPPHPDYPLQDEMKNLVLHARLNIFDSDVMFSDTMPGMPFTVGNNITLAIVSDKLEEMKTAFKKLAADGNVKMELQETFFSKSYGQLIDKFGVYWQFSYDS